MAARFKALCRFIMLQEVDEESYVILLQVQTERSRQLVQSKASSSLRIGGGHCARHKLEQEKGQFSTQPYVQKHSQTLSCCVTV